MPASADLTLTIHDIAFGGKGVARREGKVYFVPFTIPDEEVTVRVTRDKKKFAEAALVTVEKPAADRVEPGCPYFGRCGGCAYQHIAYDRQLSLKAQQVEQTLRRVGRLEHVPMRTIIPSPETYGYRNRIRVHVEDGRAGFYAHGSHALIEIEECPISRPEVNEALRSLRRATVVDGDYTLAARDRGQFFEQTNDGVARELLTLARNSVRSGQKLLIDAYCGAGFFAHHLADLFEQVIGIEANQYAVEFARRAAAPHESYIAGDVSQLLGEVLAAHDPARTTVLLDPPAAGLTPRATDLLLGTLPSEILYISCDPATLARDLGALCRSSYRLEAVTPLDMFPQTAEIETAAHLVRTE